MTPTHGRPKLRATCSVTASRISGVGAPPATSIATCRSAASSVVRTCSRSRGALFAVPLKPDGLPPAGALVQSSYERPMGIAHDVSGVVYRRGAAFRLLSYFFVRRQTRGGSDDQPHGHSRTRHPAPRGVRVPIQH